MGLAHVVHLHYIAAIETTVIQQGRVQPESRAEPYSMLLPGEAVTEFVEASVRCISAKRTSKEGRQ